MRSSFRPENPKSHTSVARIADDWYVACRSRDLRSSPRAVTILGIPIVLFRTKAGEAAALIDRCPHRNVPLSAGRVTGERLQCAYHGWEFEKGGACACIPGLATDLDSKGKSAEAFPVREQQDFVWVFATPGGVPGREPFRFPYTGEKGYFHSIQEREVDASVHATAENALDVPHTAYLHGGLFRSSKGRRTTIDVVVTRSAGSVSAEYVGEPRPKGIAARIFAPGGGTVQHVDRFILPSIAQVEYRLGAETQFCVTNALTPVTDFHTRLTIMVSVRLPFPAWLVTPVVRPFLLKIFRQDAKMLALQTATIGTFGGEQFISTQNDVLGPHISRLMKQAEQGEREPAGPTLVRNLRMIV